MTKEEDKAKSFALFKSRLFPKIKRSIHDFAEQEVTLPKGPMKGLKFDLNYAPFNRFIFDAIMDPYWRKVSVVGPTQNGKTTIATNIPLLYYLFEEQEDVIFGLPSMDLASGMWMEKIRPVIEDSPYADLLPTKGAGSRGGSFTAVRFKNGVNLRFMGAGGSAEQMSSHTAKYVLLTEIDKMDVSRGDGSEADPVSLIQMRADAFEDSKIIMECTVTNVEGRIWQETMVSGSGGQIYVPCPKCNWWQLLTPERLRFNPETAVSAEETARYECEKCEAHWDNNERLQALETPKLLHRGQFFDESNTLQGEMPPTKNFGMHYNVLHSPMQSLAKTAGQQWDADTSDLKEKKKAMIQSKWAVPYRDEDVDRDQLTRSRLRRLSETSPFKMGEVPSWTDNIIFEVDIQKGYCYWQAEAYCIKTSRSFPIEYGTVDQREDTDTGFYNMLSDVNDIAVEGWEGRSANLKLMDTGYRADLIYPWLKRNPSWYGIKGVGKGQRARMTGTKEIYKQDGIFSIRVQDDGNRIWFIEVDNTKAIVHDRYMIESENIDGYRYVAQDSDISWMKSICAEKREWDELGESFEWVKVQRRNDYLDCASYGIAGQYFLMAKEERESKKIQSRVEHNKTVHNPSLKKPPPRRQIKQGDWFSSSRSMLRR